MRNKTTLRAIWAIDAFAPSDESVCHLSETLKSIQVQLHPKTQLQIEPLYALSPDQLNLPHENAEQIVSSYESNARRAIENKIANLPNHPEVMPSRVLLHYRFSLNSLVQHVLRYAESTDTDMIVVGTQGRVGLSRLLLGSFAETLLNQSHISTLVAGSHLKSPPVTYSKILFPSDLEGSPDNESFLQVLELSHQLNSEVVLVHAIPRPMETLIQTGSYLLSGGWISIPELLEKEAKKRRELATDWELFASKRGVRIKSVVEIQSSGIVDAILKTSESEQVGMIMMQAVSGPVASAFLGSVTRQVIRLSRCPVWCFKAHPSYNQ